MTITRLTRHAIMIGFLLLLVHLRISPTFAKDEGSTPERLQPSFRFDHLTSVDGLVQNSIEAILQDSRGFMWFGTPNGLSRYDGYHFVTYQHEPGNGNSLSHNHVRALLEDQEGMIWVATEGGNLNIFSPETEEFTHVRPLRDRGNAAPPQGKPKHPAPNNGEDILHAPISGDRHAFIFQDSRGHLWFSGTKAFGLSEYDPVTGDGNTYYQRDEPGGIKGNGFYEIAESEAHELWFAADDVIIRHDPATGLFVNYEIRESNERRVKALLIGSDGNIWAGGTSGLYRFNSSSASFDIYPVPTGVNDIVETEAGLLWLATRDGLYQFDPHTEQLIGVSKSQIGVSDSLSSDQLEHLYQSQSGLVWIGSDSGLDIYDAHKARFDFYPHSIPGFSTGLAAGEIEAIYVVDDDTIWLGINSVLQKLNVNTREINQYPLEDYGLGREAITALFQDHTGRLWLGRSRGSLWQFDPNTEEFVEYPRLTQSQQPSGDFSGTPSNQDSKIIALQEDNEGFLWVVMNKGLYRINPTRDNYVRYDAPEAPRPAGLDLPPDMKIQPPVTSVLVDHENNLWFTNENGFYRFDQTTETYQRFTLLRGGGDAWTEASLEDQNSIIWIASHDGLLRFDPQTEEVTPYTTEDGLSTNFLVSLLEDSSGDLWLGTKQGLSRFTPSTGEFRNYDVFDGLQGNEFNSRIFAQASDGQMFFGGNNGLTAFYPDEIVDSVYQPPVILDDFELFNESVQPGPDSPLSVPVWQTDSLTLDHTQNFLTFEFAVLNYAFTDKNRYRYQLEGFEDQWNETDSARRFATYTNLPAGQYTFRVQAANRDGVWSGKEVALSLTMLPPWWETLWFRLFLVLATGGLILGGYQWRVYAIARRNRDLESEVAKQTQALQRRTQELQVNEIHLLEAKDSAEAASRAKSAFLANMSHELRSPLNVILGFAQVMDRNGDLSQDVHKNLDIILHSGEHLLGLINQVLDLSKIEAGHLTLDESDFDIYRLLDDLEAMFILKAEEKKIQLIFDTPAQVPRYIRADVIKLRQVLINLIGNALKFTNNGGVAVRVRSTADHDALPSTKLELRFEIEDSGPGIAPDELSQLFEVFTQTSTGKQLQEGTGLGLAISQRFVKLMGGDITVQSQVGQGATFAFGIQGQVAAPAKSESESRQQPIVGLASDQPRCRILIADDNWVNRQLLIRLLDPLDFELRDVENGQEAVELAQTFEPHLIWMDIRMPVMDGNQATQQIKASLNGSSIVIIALTASAFDEERADITAMGYDDFLRKPYRPLEIYGLISKHLGVRYEYGLAAPDDTNQVDNNSRPEDLKSELSSLSSDLVARLTEGIELGDNQMLEDVIGEIQQHNPQLAMVLTRLVEQFEYDALLTLVREVVD